MVSHRYGNHLSTRTMATVFFCSLGVMTTMVKLEKVSIMTRIFSFLSLLWSIFVSSNTADLMGNWLVMTLALHLDHYTDPWPSCTSYPI